jgi:hypothetical protein
MSAPRLCGIHFSAAPAISSLALSPGTDADGKAGRRQEGVGQVILANAAPCSNLRLRLRQPG